MSHFINFLEDIIYNRLVDINISMVAKIERFDKEKMRADVTPLLKRKVKDEEFEYPVLKEIPVNFLLSGDYYIRPEYKRDDLVYIGFSTHDIDAALNNRNELASAKIFSSENAFVIGGIAKTGWSQPNTFSREGLLIGHKNGKAFSQYLSDKVIHQFDKSVVELSNDGMKFSDNNNNEIKTTSSGITIKDGNNNKIKTSSSGVDINNGNLTVST